MTLHVHCTWGKSSIDFCICAFLSTFQTWNFSPPVSDFKQSSWCHVNLFFLIKLRSWLICKALQKSPVLSQYELLALLLILLLSHKTKSFPWESKSSQVSTQDLRLPSPFQGYVRLIQGVLIFALLFSCLEFPTAPNDLPITLKLFPMPLLPLLINYNDYYYYTVTYQAASEPPGMRDGPYLAPSSPPLTPLPTNRRPLDSSSLQRLCGQKKWKNGMVIL